MLRVGRDQLEDPGGRSEPWADLDQKDDWGSAKCVEVVQASLEPEPAMDPVVVAGRHARSIGVFVAEGSWAAGVVETGWADLAAQLEPAVTAAVAGAFVGSAVQIDQAWARQTCQGIAAGHGGIAAGAGAAGIAAEDNPGNPVGHAGPEG